MAWRNAHSLTTLLTEVNALFPNRAKGTDGGISGYTYGPGGVLVNPHNYSGHNINARGVICAFDITTGDYPGGINPAQGRWLAERIRIAMRDQARGQTPYVIHWMAPPYVAIAGPKIASAYDNWAWHTYYGDDDHKSHIHPSVDWDIPHSGAPSTAAYDTTLSWNLGDITGQGSSITPITSEEDDMFADKDRANLETTLGRVTTLVAMLDNVANAVTATPGRVLDKQVPRAGSKATTSLGLFLSYADADREATISRINGAIASLPAQDIAAEINAAGIAADVRDELVKLLGGAK